MGQSKFIHIIKGVLILIMLVSGAICSNAAKVHETNLWPVILEVNKDGVNIRSDSTVSASVIGKVNSGEKLLAVYSAYNWYKVKLPGGLKLYIYRKYIKFDSNRALVTADRVNIRSGPGTSYPVLGQLKSGQVLRICYSRNGNKQWSCVYSDDLPVYGWIHSKFVKVVGVARSASIVKRTLNKTRTKKVTKTAEVKTVNKKIIPIAKESDKNTIKKDLPIAIGVVRELGRLIGRKYDYKLVNAKGKIRYYLTGDNHSFAAFSGRKVKIYGEIIRVARDNIPVIEVHKIELLR